MRDRVKPVCYRWVGLQPIRREEGRANNGEAGGEVSGANESRAKMMQCSRGVKKGKGKPTAEPWSTPWSDYPAATAKSPDLDAFAPHFPPTVAARDGGPHALIFGSSAPRRRRLACRDIRMLAARLTFREPPGVRARLRRRAAHASRRLASLRRAGLQKNSDAVKSAPPGGLPAAATVRPGEAALACDGSIGCPMHSRFRARRGGPNLDVPATPACLFL